MNGRILVKGHQKRLEWASYKILQREFDNTVIEMPLIYKRTNFQEDNIRRYYNHISYHSKYEFKDETYNANMFVELKL